MERSTHPFLIGLDLVLVFALGAMLGALAQYHNTPERMMVPPPDTLHQRVIDRCVSCHLTEGGPLG